VVEIEKKKKKNFFFAVIFIFFYFYFYFFSQKLSFIVEFLTSLAKKESFWDIAFTISIVVLD